MTSGNALARHHPVMRWIWSLVMVLIASSLMMTTTVHACELSGKITVECTGTVTASSGIVPDQSHADKGMSHGQRT